jgi:hypothetical protein
MEYDFYVGVLQMLFQQGQIQIRIFKIEHTAFE